MAAAIESDRPFVGRVELLRDLRERLEEARAHRGGVTLVTGERGVGKSALVNELLREVRQGGVPVIVGRSPAIDDPPPFSLIRSAFANMVDEPTRVEEGRGSSLPADAALPRLGPHAAEETTPDLVSVERRLLSVLSGTEDHGRPSRDRVLTTISEQFLVLTHSGLAVLVLEDIHRADDSSLHAVEFLAERLRDEPLWILATSRPLPSLTDTGRARLEKLSVVTRAKQLTMGPMTPEEAAEFLHVLDPSSALSKEDLARGYSETGGIPLLLQQLDLHAAPRGPAQPAPPAGVPSLEQDEQRVLNAASVLGPEFRSSLLFRLTGGEDEARFNDRVHDLVRRGMLVERDRGLLSFSEDRLREEVYRHLSDHQREVLHWSAGEALEGSEASGVARVYSLARHFYLGRSGEKAIKYNRLAAEIADRALAPDVARDHLLRALESERWTRSKDPTVAAEVTLELARVAEGLGHLAEAERILREFLRSEQDGPHVPLPTRASLEIFLARVLTDRGDLPAASELAQKVLITPGLEGHPLVLVGGHHQLGQALYYLGEYEGALAHHNEELRLARVVGNPMVILRARVWRLAALAMIGPTDQAIQEAREVTAARDRLGSVRESAQAHLFFGDLLADSRSLPTQRAEAVDQYELAIQFAEKAQDPRRIGWASYKIGELLREARRFPEATERLNTASQILGQIGDQVGLSMATKVRGQIAMDQGSYPLAATYLEEAARLLRGLNHALEEIDVQLCLAQLSLKRGDVAGARRQVGELERLHLPQARPDLVHEFDGLKHELASKEVDHAGT